MCNVSQSNFHHIVSWIEVHTFSYRQLLFQRRLMMLFVKNMVIIIIITNSIISHFVTIELDILALASTEVQESIVAT